MGRSAQVSPVTGMSAPTTSIRQLSSHGRNSRTWLIDVHCAELAFRLAQAKRRSPPLMWLRGHNHTSAIAHINTAEDTLGQAMLDFIDHPR